MLKALELVGFKSFADKTRFEFRTGITAVVGPNGSGKSNVVDAIKWVLGEQSVKSLRGKEMADCIFNGSSTRAPLNSAECTLTFDNSHNLLPVDTAEVHITRRVYRSGEGEYLINRQPCRLRDIRDLFAGTGAATEAYSVIEQGKVDVLLQSSPKDRRAIFEEAAGISRFKAKKVETLRRLDRVEQNLTRLADIVTEVDNQLRSVRAQATKAQRYREYSGRLQELRTQVASADWRGMTAKLGEIETQLEARRQQAAEAMAEIERLEAAGLELETEAGQITEDIRRIEARLAENRERIAAAESTIAHSRQLSQELAEEEGRLRKQVAALSARAGDLQHKYVQLQSGVDVAETEHAESRNHLATQQRALTELTERVDQVRAESEQLRVDYLETMRSAARLGNDIGAFQSQVETAQGRSEQLLSRQEQLEQDKATWKLQYEQLRTEFGALEQQVQQREEARAKAASTLSQRRSTLAARQKEMATYRQQLSEASGRAAVLEELEQRLEGLRSGVKEVLLEARGAEQGPLTQVRGLVAELFEVATDKAALIEAALGETAQHLVVAPGHELWEAIQQQTYRLPGRVGFIRQKPVVVSQDEDFEHLRDEAGVLHRAADLVECEDHLRPLAEHLLGRTWIVDNLARAFQLLATTGTGCRFVTTSGELLDSDGTLTAGPRLAAGGLISRRSELRELRQRIITLELQARGVEDEVESLETQIDADESRLRVAEREHRDATQMAADHRLATNAAGQKLTQLDEQLQTLADELGLLDEKLTAAQASIGQATAQRMVLEQQIANQEARQAELSSQLEQLDAQRQQQLQTVTACQVTLAKSEERLGNLREQLRALEQTKEERGRLIAEAQDQLANNQRRMSSSQQSILQAGAAVAELFLTKEQFAAEAVALIQQRTELTGRRNALTGQTSAARNRLKAAEQAIHEHDLAAGEIRLQRANLVQQLRDEYDIDLTGLDEQNDTEPTDEREAVDEEIGSLRRKLNNLGSVNLDSLEELDALEARHSSLSGQYNDLVAAKTALERIINRINTDSRRLFAETLETVRGHFQQLFRKLFGGGQADIIVEDDVDLLDSGIEIIARPPGKEPRNISLLSGGEKTMTCVALLLSIFKSRPSPFCVLDEVDAALDEANIERFISVLKEFLSSTQFIVVTHSKKTMTCAGTLYGVTMQESGISKRVSVHFDDVSEDGQLSESARRRAEAAEDDSAAA